MKNSYETEIKKLKEKLESDRKIIHELKRNSFNLKKAIWDMLNYANMYVLMLDKDMTIQLINWSLATDLGAENEKELIGRNWLDFIPDEYKKIIKIAHLEMCTNIKDCTYREMSNEVMKLDGSKFLVKWFNIPINHGYNITFSIGLKINVSEATVVSEDSIRAYYRDIINKDRTMIKSLKEFVKTDKFPN